jgi:hypothetical protein
VRNLTLLVDVFANSYNAIQQERLKNKEIKRIQNSGPTGILDTPETQLFFVLYYLKTYPTFDVLGFHFDLSAGHAHDYVVVTVQTPPRNPALNNRNSLILGCPAVSLGRGV